MEQLLLFGSQKKGCKPCAYGDGFYLMVDISWAGIFLEQDVFFS